MKQVTLPWLLEMLLATRGGGRDHGKNLDVIKAIRDSEVSSLTALFAAVLTGAVALFVGFGTLVYTNITERIESGSRTVEEGTTTTLVKTFDNPGATTADIGLAIVLATSVGVVVALLLRIHEDRRVASETYTEGVRTYFRWSRRIP